MPELVITDPVGLLSQRLVDRHLAAAVTALAVFEYVITFNDELCTAWRRRLNATSLLLISTRWVMVIAPTLAWATLSTQSCTPIQTIIQVFYIISTAQTALFSSLRVFALWERNWTLLFLNLAVGLIPAGCTAFLMARSTYIYLDPPFDACYQNVSISSRTWSILIWLPAIATIAGNTLVLALTWAKTFRAVWMLRHMNPMSLVACMLRDGTIYFLILLALNVTQPITYYLTPSKPMSTFGLVIPAMLMSRFIMNLRRFGEIESSRSGSGYTDSRPVRFTTPMVTAPTGFLGNIGEELDHSQADSRGEDVDEAFLEDRDLGSASFVVGSQMRGTTAAPSTDGTSYDTLKAAVYVNV